MQNKAFGSQMPPETPTAGVTLTDFVASPLWPASRGSGPRLPVSGPRRQVCCNTRTPQRTVHDVRSVKHADCNRLLPAHERGKQSQQRQANIVCENTARRGNICACAERGVLIELRDFGTCARDHVSETHRDFRYVWAGADPESRSQGKYPLRGRIQSPGEPPSCGGG